MEREEIYRERKIIEDFGVDEKNTLNNSLFDVLFQIDYVSNRSNMEKTMLDLFNDAYYVCTSILLEKRPYFKIKKYKDIIGVGNNSIHSYDTNRVIIVMSMVSIYLKTLDFITDDIDKTINVIKTEFSGCDGNIYETISSVADRREWTTKATDFYPMKFPGNEQCGVFWKGYKDFPNQMEEIIKQSSLFYTTGKEEFDKSVILKELKENQKRKDEEISKLKIRVKELKKKIELLEEKNKGLETQHKEDEARLLAGFGTPVIEARDFDVEVVNHKFIETDTCKALTKSKKQKNLGLELIKEMDAIVKDLIDKIGQETVPLKNIVDKIKEKGKYCGLKEAYNLFEQINSMLGNEPAWQNNKEELKKFFDSLLSENSKKPLIGKVKKLEMKKPIIYGSVYDISQNDNVNIGGKKDDEEE